MWQLPCIVFSHLLKAHPHVELLNLEKAHYSTIILLLQVNIIMNHHTLMMAFWILRDKAPPNELWQNIQAKYHHNLTLDRHFKNRKGAQWWWWWWQWHQHSWWSIKAPNDSDYLELWPQHPNFAINHLLKSQITKVSRS